MIISYIYIFIDNMIGIIIYRFFFNLWRLCNNLICYGLRVIGFFIVDWLEVRVFGNEFYCGGLFDDV